MTVPAILTDAWSYVFPWLKFGWEFLKGEHGNRIEASIVAALIGIFISSYFKKKRLRLAIKIEIEIIANSYAEKLTDENKEYLIKQVTTSASYRILFITSQKRTIIGNLDDDVSYLSEKAIKSLICFSDTAELIDDAIRVLRSETFISLTTQRKLQLLEQPFALQKEIETYREELNRYL